MKLGMKCIGCLLLLLLLSGFEKLNAKDDEKVWEFISPRPDSAVNSGELFMLVKYAEKLHLTENSVQVYLDNRIISNNVKITDNKITMLYMLPLKEGNHKLEVVAKSSRYGNLQPISTTFIVKGKTVRPDGTVIESEKQKKFGLNGMVASEFRVEDISGPGASLRQEPPFTRNTYLNATANAGQFYIPVSLFLTSDQYTYSQTLLPRNTFRVGLNVRGFEGQYGDLNPNFDRLVLPGTRVRGTKVGMKGKRAGIQYIDGYTQTAIDGQVFQFTSSAGLPPQTLQPDSSYFTIGQFQRRISALNFSFGNIREGAATGISIMRAYDKLNSIHFGTSPKDNIVFGLQQSFMTNESKMKVTGGIAYSFYTNNTSLGSVSKHEIDSIYDMKLPVDPEKTENLFVINTTTTQPGKPSSAGFINMALRAKNFITTLEYKYLGSSFRSLGNPFLRTDLRIGGIQEQVFLFKRKLNLNLRYTIQANNLMKNQLTTLTTHSGFGSLLFAPSEKLPQFGLSYTTQYRITKASRTALKFAAANENFNSITGNINYYFDAFGARHGINLMYSQMERVNLLYGDDKKLTQLASAGITEDLIPINLVIELHYSTMYYTGTAQTMVPMFNIYNGNIRYKIKKLKTEIGGGYGLTHSFGTTYGQSSKRPLYSGRIRNESIKDFSIDIESGVSPFYDQLDTMNNYDEFFAILRLGYKLKI